ncbi:MAG: transcriptional repressor [Gammaproteobacteria bacterium]|nr:transcriptional repressor [Gammaproteobacteria bacterium]
MLDALPNKSDIEDRLRRLDINPTHQRVEIAQVLFSRSVHLSADQVLEFVNQNDRQVSKATVYNTLGLFAEKGLVREVIIDPSRVFYDPNIEPHHHFYNLDSGELTDIQSDLLQLDRLPPLPEGTQTDGVEVVIKLRNRDHQLPT